METEVTSASEPTTTAPKVESETHEDVDALYDSIMKPDMEPDDPINGDTEESNSDDTPEAPNKGDPDSNSDDLFTLKHKDFENGERSFDRDKVTEYAQKGFDYELKLQRLNDERKEFDERHKSLETELDAFNKKREYWQNIDTYMSENPGFAQTVEEQWNKVQGNNPALVSPEYRNLQSKLSELQGRLDAKDQENLDIVHRKAEEIYGQNLAKYKEANPDFDWDTKDELGQDLAEKIEKHGVENGIKKFAVAADSYLIDQKIKMAGMKAKEQAAKELQEQRKKGLGPITDYATTRRTTEAQNVSEMSYENLAKEALEEMGMAD